ncbi:MAG: efflux RND transporter periplasmic adaptor subunit [Firmicutes bacterium]|nr:efflux RND transporter periplasmic adaptor subunit [Bacillota bacterium]
MSGTTDVKKKNNVVVISILLIAIIAGVWTVVKTAGHNKNHSKEPKPVQVKVKTVETMDLPEEIKVSGNVAPKREAQIAPKIMSPVVEVLVREGDHVKQGQLLAKLEAKDLQAQVDQAESAVGSAWSMSEKAKAAADYRQAQSSAAITNAEAEYRMAKENLSMVMEGPRQQQKTQNQLALAQAEAQFRNEEIEIERMKRLYDEGVIPKQKYEQAQTRFEVIKNQFGIAQQQASMSDEGSRNQEVASAKERLKQAEANLRLARASGLMNRMAEKDAQASDNAVSQAVAMEKAAKIRRDYAEIRAPFDGTVTARSVDPGDMASPGVPIFTIEDKSYYRLETRVGVKDIKNVKPGMRVSLEIGTAKRTGTGTVSVVAPAGDPSTRKFLVKIDIPEALHPASGDYGTAGFKVGISKGIAIPADTIREIGGISNIFVASPENRANMRIIRTGRTTEQGVEVVSGLEKGEKLIIWSESPLSDDMPINPVEVRK